MLFAPARRVFLRALELDGAKAEKFLKKKYCCKKKICPGRGRKSHAPLPSLGVNRRRAVEYAHMNSPVMQNSSSPDTPKGSSRSFFTYTVIALGLALFIRFFIAAPYVVSGASMEPTFYDWHYLIIDRIS